MRSCFKVFSAAVMMLGILGDLGAAKADYWSTYLFPGRPHVQTVDERNGHLRIVWRQPIYGNSRYRCARFSFECFWTRPILYFQTYVTYRHLPSAGHRSRRNGRSVDASEGTSVSTLQSEPGYVYQGRSVTVIKRVGGFARISAPGNSSRWVRTSALLRNE